MYSTELRTNRSAGWGRALAILASGLVVASTAALKQAVEAGASVQAQIFVSAAGSDANPGTQAQPVQSLQRAQQLVRAIDGSMSGDVIVYLEPGLHRLSAPLALTPADSGTNGHNVVWAAADPTQTTIVSGAVQVTGWTLTDPARNLWRAPAPTGLTDTRQLYVNGVRADRSRGRLPVGVTTTTTGYTAGSSVMASWRNPADIEFVYTGGNAWFDQKSVAIGTWTEQRCPVQSISGTTITMAQPCWTNSTHRPSTALSGITGVGAHPQYIENAYELLGTPGQWYLDRAAQTFYYVPRTGEDMSTADVEAPSLESLVSGAGTATSPIHNVIFSGLQFAYATWLGPNGPNGYSDTQAGLTVDGTGGGAHQGWCGQAAGGTCPYGAWDMEPGNVGLSYDSQIQFLYDDFVHLGATGLALGDGSQNDTVQGCVFTDISGSGIELGGDSILSPSAGQVVSGNQILDSHLYDLPVEFSGAIGLFIGYASNTLVAHDEIDHTSYSAISVGWGGWAANSPNPTHGNVFANDLIHDYLEVLSDGGGIYHQNPSGPSVAAGEKIDETVIYNQWGSGHGVYMDTHSGDVTATNDVIFNTNHDNWAEWGSVHDVDFENLYWEQGDSLSAGANAIVRNNRVITSLSEAPSAILDNAGLEPAFQWLHQKTFSPPSAPDAPHPKIGVAPGNGSAYIAWLPPLYEGTSPIQSFTVTANPGGQSATISAADFLRLGYAQVTGLSNGTSYTFTVTASNAAGISPPSVPTNPVVPAGGAGRPSAPINSSAQRGDSAASIHFGPASGGAEPVLSYTVTANPGGITANLTGHKYLSLAANHVTFGVLPGLTNGTTYTVTIVANNGAGAGPAATVTVTPTAYGPPAPVPTPSPLPTPTPIPPPGGSPISPPGPSSGVTAVATGGGQADVTWTPPTTDGGAAVSAYAVYAYSPSGTSPILVSTGPSLAASGLTANAYYVFTVTAWNGTYWGAWSAWSAWTWIT